MREGTECLRTILSQDPFIEARTTARESLAIKRFSDLCNTFGDHDEEIANAILVDEKNKKHFLMLAAGCMASLGYAGECEKRMQREHWDLRNKANCHGNPGVRTGTPDSAAENGRDVFTYDRPESYVFKNYGNRFPIYLMTHVQTPEFRESFFCSRHMVPRCRVFLFATFHASPTIIVAQQKTKVHTIQSGISQMGRLYRPERRVCRRYIRQHTLWVIL